MLIFAAKKKFNMADIFERLLKDYGPIGMYRERAHGYFAFPKLEGEIGNHMKFRGKDVIVWSLNNYLGLANHPEVIKEKKLMEMVGRSVK